jgi:uncharacterized protein
MTPEPKPDFVSHLIAGAEHFNAREFWDAHESWEAIWLHAQTDVEQFLQGLIQVAAAYHHVQRGTFRGGVRLFDSGLRRLEPFARNFCGISREAVEVAARSHREWAAARVAAGDYDARIAENEYPKLVLSHPCEPSNNW